MAAPPPFSSLSFSLGRAKAAAGSKVTGAKLREPSYLTVESNSEGPATRQSRKVVPYLGEVNDRWPVAGRSSTWPCGRLSLLPCSFVPNSRVLMVGSCSCWLRSHSLARARNSHRSAARSTLHAPCSTTLRLLHATIPPPIRPPQGPTHPVGHPVRTISGLRHPAPFEDRSQKDKEAWISPAQSRFP